MTRENNRRAFCRVRSVRGAGVAPFVSCLVRTALFLPVFYTLVTILYNWAKCLKKCLSFACKTQGYTCKAAMSHKRAGMIVATKLNMSLLCDPSWKMHYNFWRCVQSHRIGLATHDSLRATEWAPATSVQGRCQNKLVGIRSGTLLSPLLPSRLPASEHLTRLEELLHPEPFKYRTCEWFVLIHICITDTVLAVAQRWVQHKIYVKEKRI